MFLVTNIGFDTAENLQSFQKLLLTSYRIRRNIGGHAYVLRAFCSKRLGQAAEIRALQGRGERPQAERSC